MRFHSVFIVGLFVHLLSLAGCSSQETEQADGLVSLSLGDATIEVELAVTPQQQQRGLMRRASMPENQGMLFVFSKPKQMSFWMRNTKIPLDIGYFTEDGVLREIYKLYPHDETSKKSVRSDLYYALEMNQGWFKANNVKAGDRIDLSVLPL